jgi:hypothetical protein
MSSHLLRYLSTVSPAKPCLPLIHATDIHSFRDIRETGVLNPALSNDFDENLVYLFYGRPGYRIGARSLSRSDYAFLPVCFVFKATAVTEIARIYPFDTGAYTAELFQQFLHPRMTLNAFSLGADPIAPQRLVTAFFQNNSNYFFGRYRRDLQFEIEQLEAQTYYDIISQTGEIQPDDRRYTVELQTRNPVVLTGSLLCVVLPTQALQCDAIKESVDLWGAQCRTYPVIRGFRMTEYHGLVVDRVLTFLQEEELL